jgi:hypothetical protein
MERQFGQCDDGQLLAIIDTCLDALTDHRLRLPTDTQQLELLHDGVRLGGRLQAWAQQQAAAIEESEAA